MNLRLLGFLLLVPIAAAASEPPAVRVALFEFKSSADADAALGAPGSGARITTVLANNLRVLAPVAVASGPELGRAAPPDSGEPSQALEPEQARALGSATHATSLAFGRVYKSSTGFILAVKMVGAARGETVGAIETLGSDERLADALSRLARQIGLIACTQAGLKAPDWPDAAIVGTHEAGSPGQAEASTSIFALDEKQVPKDIDEWDKVHPLSPGIHQVLVRYYDGQEVGSYAFLIAARPGATYEAHAVRAGATTAKLWIQAREGKGPATPYVTVALETPKLVMTPAVDSDIRFLSLRSLDPYATPVSNAKATPKPH